MRMCVPGLGSGELEKLQFNRLTIEDKKIDVPDNLMDNRACQSVSIENDDYRIVHVLRVYLMMVEWSLDSCTTLPDDLLMWSTKSGHRVKALRCHNEVNDDSSNE